MFVEVIAKLKHGCHLLWSTL